MSQIDFEELDPDVQAEIRRRAGMAPDDSVSSKQKRKGSSDAGRKRVATGKEFEAELDLVHSMYEFKKWGKIRRHYIPTRFEKADARGAVRRAIGPADVDRTGWVRVFTALGSATRASDEPGSGHVVPVAFDAKVLGEGVREGWYFHEERLQHQLHGLKASAEAGEAAFLLVYDRGVERVFGVPILPHFTALLMGHGVQLWYRLGSEVRAELPNIEPRAGSLRWDWIPMLHHLTPSDR